MDFFSVHKHPHSAAIQMHALSVSTLEPYRILAAPIFVFLKKNQKFIAIKSPLDFFSPEEIQRLMPYQNVYVPKTISEIWRFQNAGRSVKTVLEWGMRERKDRLGLKMGEVMLPPASYEVADAVLKIVAPLWSQELRIESFFVFFLMEEICPAWSPEFLQKWRNIHVELFEKGLLVAGWMSFLSLLMGYQRVEYLNDIRNEFAQRMFSGEDLSSRVYNQEIEELFVWIKNLLEASNYDSISLMNLSQGEGRALQKLNFRVNRIQADLLKDAPSRISLRGLWGFLSA